MEGVIPPKSAKKKMAKLDKIIDSNKFLSENWPECKEFFEEQKSKIKRERDLIASKIGKK